MCVPAYAFQAADKPGGSAVANRSCIVRVACDPATLELDHYSISLLMTTICQNVYPRFGEPDPPSDVFTEVLALEWLGADDNEKGRDGVLVGILSLDWENGGIDPPRKGFWQAVTAEAAKVLKQASDQEVQRLRAQLDEARKSLQLNVDEMRQLQQRYQTMCEQTGMSDLSTESVTVAMRKLEERLERNALDVASMDSRQEAIIAQIAEIGERAEAAEDPLVAEMEGIVEGLEGRVERVKQLMESGRATTDEILPAREQLLQARLRLLERQEQAQRRAGGARLEQLNAELAEVAIQSREARARLAWVHQRLDEVREKNIRAAADEYEREIAIRLPYLKGQAERIQMRILELQENLQSHRVPTVTILGSD
jgi:hypothetical protein